MAPASNNDIARAIYIASKEEGATEEFFQKVVRFLSRKRLLPKAKDILFRLNRIINDEEGRIEARVISKGELGGEAKKELKQTLARRYSAKEVLLDEKVDESVLGGFRIEVGDEVIDLTTRNKIVKLQEYLTKNA